MHHFLRMFTLINELHQFHDLLLIFAIILDNLMKKILHFGQNTGYTGTDGPTDRTSHEDMRKRIERGKMEKDRRTEPLMNI